MSIIGNSKWEITHDTLIAALQKYFDDKVFLSGKAPRVVSIAEQGRGSGIDQPVTFRIELSGVARAEAQKA